MKRLFSIVIALSLLLLSSPLHCASEALSDCDYDGNGKCETRKPLGYGSYQGTTTTTSMSMLGWGLGLAAAIAIVAGVIHQSAAVHSDSSSSSSTSGSDSS
ncbi:MAG: hypothetical protein K1060chlam2_01110 [Chlamydiae bacterium]|nr:hypothetical protein [Chlamydiota bacterium]